MTKSVSKGDAKTVKCEWCDATQTVSKWSSNEWRCGEHTPGVTESNDEAPVEERPVDKVRHSQEVLGVLGFTITSRGYHKVYHDGQAAIRIEPMFDKGVAADATYALIGFAVTRQEVVAITDAEIASKIPSVAHQDIQTITTELRIKMPGVELKRRHVDVLKCSKCGTDTEEWMQLGSSILCLKKCAKAVIRKPFKHT